MIQYGKYVPVIVVLVLFSSLIFSGNYHNASDPVTPPKVKWSKYNTDEGHVKIKFPFPYEITEEQKEKVKTVKVRAKSGEDFFYLAYTIHIDKLIDNEHLAEVSLESFAETLHGKIVQQEDYIVNGQSGVKAKIVMQDVGAEIFYRAIIIGQIQYQLIALDVSKSYKEEREVFFDSFRILE